jgi:hypothetical protein
MPCAPSSGLLSFKHGKTFCFLLASMPEAAKSKIAALHPAFLLLATKSTKCTKRKQPPMAQRRGREEQLEGNPLDPVLPLCSRTIEPKVRGSMCPWRLKFFKFGYFHGTWK